MSQDENIPVLLRTTMGFMRSAGLLLLGLAALLAAASFAGFTPSTHKWNNQHMLIPNAEHDFQLIQLGEFRRDQFLLDRKTGRVWQPVCSGKSTGPDCAGEMVWVEMTGAGR